MFTARYRLNSSILPILIIIIITLLPEGQTCKAQESSEHCSVSVLDSTGRENKVVFYLSHFKAVSKMFEMCVLILCTNVLHFPTAVPGAVRLHGPTSHEKHFAHDRRYDENGCYRFSGVCWT